jgi:cystathionine gamma-synthase
MQERSLRSGSHVDVRLVHFLIYPEDKQSPVDPEFKTKVPPVSAGIDLHIVLFPADSFSLAKEFWQHSGLGISSRMADHCLSMLPDDPRQPSSPTSGRPLCKPMNRHYSAKSPSRTRSPSGPMVHPTIIPPSNQEYTCPDALRRDECVYLEERYGRNLPLSSASSAKKALRCRIAGVLVHDSPDYSDARQDVEVGPSSRGISEVSESDVFLFSTGMAAIWSAHNLILSIRPEAKSVCFGCVVHMLG